MTTVAKFVGLDVHKDTISIAVCEGGTLHEAADLGKIPHDLTRLLRKLERLGSPETLHVAYEAGPTGYGLCRKLRALDIDCLVVAPSKTPVRAGDRVKTDRRDAQKLARYLRSGELVAVGLPEIEHEALRDLVRLREDAMHALQRARQQLGGFLLRHGRIYEGKSAWTKRHLQWIRSQRFEMEGQRQTLESYFAEMIHASERLDQMTALVEKGAQAETFAPLFRALQALRGVCIVVAATLVAELGDLRRFPSAPQLMSFIGLTPSEHSSGQSTQRGSITKAGNTHVRRVLIEAAWCTRLRPAMSAALKRRNQGLPLRVQEIAWKAQHRLHNRYWKMILRGKTKQNTIVAIARELTGFVWAIGQEVGSKTEQERA